MAIKQTRLIMGMPITIEIIDSTATEKDLDFIFTYFIHIDNVFSTYKETSEITNINRGQLDKTHWSYEMKTVFELSAQTEKETNGYFNIQKPDGSYDPSGLVKGWAIWNASQLLDKLEFKHYFIDAGGDVQTQGRNAEGKKWSVGIKNPFHQEETVKVVYLNGQGIATSGNYIRGNHIYNPTENGAVPRDVVSLTVIGPNVYEADRFATAGFAMGIQGIQFIEKLANLEGYMIDKEGIATLTTGFNQYITE